MGGVAGEMEGDCWGYGRMKFELTAAEDAVALVAAET
jgi:hypothetical protein